MLYFEDRSSGLIYAFSIRGTVTASAERLVPLACRAVNAPIPFTAIPRWFTIEGGPGRLDRGHPVRLSAQREHTPNVVSMLRPLADRMSAIHLTCAV
jgi:hypothetical protein